MEYISKLDCFENFNYTHFYKRKCNEKFQNQSNNKRLNYLICFAVSLKIGPRSAIK